MLFLIAVSHVDCLPPISHDDSDSTSVLRVVKLNSFRALCAVLLPTHSLPVNTNTVEQRRLLDL